MTEKEIIEMLLAQNDRLMKVIETFANKEIKMINDIKVNSYNGSNASAIAPTNNSNTDQHAKNLNTGKADKIGDNTNKL